MATETSVWPEHHHPLHAPVNADSVMARCCANVLEALERRGIDCTGAECNEDLLALAHAVGMYDEACTAAEEAGGARGRLQRLPPRLAQEAIGAYVERLSRDAHRLAHHCG